MSEMQFYRGVCMCGDWGNGCVKLHYIYYCMIPKFLQTCGDVAWGDVDVLISVCVSVCLSPLYKPQFCRQKLATYHKIPSYIGEDPY